MTIALDAELEGAKPVPSRICATVLSDNLIACNFFSASISSLTIMMRICCSSGSSRSSQTDSKVTVSCTNLVTEKSTFLPSAVVVLPYRLTVGTRSGIASLAIVCKAAIVWSHRSTRILPTVQRHLPQKSRTDRRQRYGCKGSVRGRS